MIPRFFRGCDMLSPRERQVLDHVCVGRKAKEIARRLGIAPCTVETYRLGILNKYRLLGLRNMTEIVVLVCFGYQPLLGEDNGTDASIFRILAPETGAARNICAVL